LLPIKICKGEDVEMIDEAGLCYATTIALTNAINSASENDVYNYFANALDYLKKLATVEFSIFFVRKIVGLRSELKDCDTYSKFKIDNQDLEI